MDNNKRRQKLKKFNDVYYGDLTNKSLDTNFKYNQLPYWMDSYGHYLDMELDNKMPKYYNYFSQGTIIMTDFGVNVGSEMSGGHFAVVLNSDDNKYKKSITVVPLTSKYHKGHVSIEKELFTNIISLANDKNNQLISEKNLFNNEINDLVEELKETNFSFDEDNDLKIMRGFLGNDAEDVHFVLDSDDPRNSDYFKLAQQLSNIENIESHPKIVHFISKATLITNRIDHLNMLAKNLKYKLSEMDELTTKVKKYNKDTYVNISNVVTISKLRSTKISEFTISGNVKISQKSINKIKESLINKMK